MFVGIKVRLYPNNEQIKQIEKNFNNVRYVYNYFLNYAKENKCYSLNKWLDLLSLLKEFPETSFLKSEDKTIYEYTLKHLSRAFQDYFNKIRNHPKPKKVSYEQTYSTKYKTAEIKISKNNIYLPLIGDVKCKISKDIKINRILSITIKKNKANIYEASLLSTVNIEPLPKTSREVGIDLGVRKLITTSDAETFVSSLSFNDTLKKIRLETRKLYRKKRGSKNYTEQRIKLAKLYQKQENYINDQIHKATKYLVTNYDVIIMEDLNIEQLVKKQQFRKHKSNLLHAALGKIRKQLIYKCKMYNKKLIIIDRYFASSKICSNCGNYYEVGPSEIYKCPHCDQVIDRDVNAAINILRFGKKK